MVTLHDVARKSGVTAATVSNVIRSKGAVGEATRQRVLKAIEELGYRPNLMARGLVEGKSFTLALIVENIANSFYGEVALEIERNAREKGYHLLLYNAHEGPDVQKSPFERIPGGWVDGVIAIAGMSATEALDLYQQGRAIVLGNWQDFGVLPEMPTVDIDFEQAGYLAGQHLIELGHQRIAVIVSGNAETRKPAHARRFQGFCQALLKASIALSDSHLEFADGTTETGYSAAKKLLALEEPPTAIFASNDMMAIGALSAASDMGLQVPEELSILGIDDIALDAYVRPSLTTVALARKSFTEAIITSLMNQLEKKALPELHISIEPELIERQSTARPKSFMSSTPALHRSLQPVVVDEA